jgi:hypothetical protein
MPSLFAVIGCVLALALSDARAEDLQAAQACTRITDGAPRLACYDAAFGLAKPPSAPQSPATQQSPSAQQSSGTQQSPARKPDALARFGDTGQLHPERKSMTDLPKNVTAQVQQVTPLAKSLYQVTLDNGQVWQTTQADWAIAFRAGDRVTISRLPLGGYQISVAGNNLSIGAKRIK